MASKLINHTLSSLTAGVTQQYQEGRFENQVSAMVNCMPSITRGVLRRNPIDISFQLYKDAGGTTPLSLNNAFTYAYDRGTGTEQYFIVIVNGATDATKCEMYVYNKNNTNGIPLLIKIHTYLELPIGEYPRTNFEMVTIGDHTFVLNKTKTVAMDATAIAPGSTQLSSWAFYWIKKTTGVIIEQKQSGTDPVLAGGRLEGYAYTLNGKTIVAEKASAPLTATPDADPTYYSNGVKASDIASKIGTVLSYTTEKSFVYKTSSITAWDWSDTFGDEASLGVWDSVDSADKLPANLVQALDGFIVKVSGGTSVKDDDYYLKYVYAERTWREVAKPGEVVAFDYTTMPHSLYRLADGSFVFDQYKEVAADGLSLLGTAWADRLVGDSITNEDPSFVGKQIYSIFFHKNRLGFITKDSVVLSGTGEYGNFFGQTVQEILDDDPIDLAIATTDVTVLRRAVDTAGSLILFADDSQFVLDSLDGPLTPNTANIKPVSNYTYNKNTKATAIGNKVFFTSLSGGYTQVYAYKLSDNGAQVTEAIPMTLHIPSFIPSTASSFVGHDVLGYNFIQDSVDKKTLTVLTNTSLGKEDLQNAFHTWTFSEDVEGLVIIANDLYLVSATGKFGRIKLEIPGDMTAITYGDKDIDATYITYDSYINFSQFFWRDANGKGTSRGRLQLRTLLYSIDTTISRFETVIVNSNLRRLVTDIDFGPTWVDTDTWDDLLIWMDIDPLYSRIYKDDEKVTVMSDSRYAEITFRSSTDAPLVGFELATANIEMLYHQRSTRT